MTHSSIACVLYKATTNKCDIYKAFQSLQSVSPAFSNLILKNDLILLNTFYR